MDAWTDGSNRKDEVYGYGCIIVQDGQAIHESYKAYNTDEYRKYRNVAGETFGVLYAILYALQQGAKELNVYYDYIGLEKWAVGKWRAGNVLSQYYVKVVKEASKHLTINYHKVLAHSGVEFNERADQLAKKSIEEWLNEHSNNN